MYEEEDELFSLEGIHKNHEGNNESDQNSQIQFSLMTSTQHASLQREDHMDRALKQLQQLQQSNKTLSMEIANLNKNPNIFINPIKNQLTNQINSMREENQSLKQALQKAKAPAYSEMTKKKIMYDSTKYGNENEIDLHKYSSSKPSQRSSMRCSLKNSTYKNEFHHQNQPRGNPLDRLDTNSNHDKQDSASTCLNYNYHNQSSASFNYGEIESTQDHQAIKANIAEEIRLLLKKAEIFDQELMKIDNQERSSEIRRTNRDEEELQKIEVYKKKLLALLKKLKLQEGESNNLVKAYRQIYEQTLSKLNEATRALQLIQQAQISEDVDEKYAEVLELQEALSVINAQLDELDQDKWLHQIVKQLSKAVRRIGIQLPQFKEDKNIREIIDQLCEILIECNLCSRKDSANKLILLKQYHEEDKKNKNKLILAMKSKEQILGRNLIDLQMEK